MHYHPEVARKGRGPASLVAVTVAALTLAACGSSSSSSSQSGTASAKASGATASIAFEGAEATLPQSYPVAKPPSRPFTIGYQEIFAPAPEIRAIAAAVDAEAKRLGGRSIALDDAGSATVQVNNCKTLVAERVDALVVYPYDPNALAPCFKAAAAKKIAVILQNTPGDAAKPLPTDALTNVMQGFDLAGYLRAKEIARVAPGSTFAYVGLAARNEALTYAKERLFYWAKRFGLKFEGEADAQGGQPAASATVMASLTARYPNVGTVFVFQDSSALAAAKVAESAGKKVRVVGYNGERDAVAAVGEGKLFATVSLDIGTLAKNMVAAGVDHIEGVNIPQRVTTPNVLVTSANAKSVKTVG